MIKKFSDVSLKQCILLPQFENCLRFLNYVIAYEYFLAKADFIHMLYPNVYDYFVSAQRRLEI
jgi:hypothetical protein